MAVGLGDTQDVFYPAHEHRVGLVEVELQVAHEHDVARAVAGEEPVEKLQGFKRIRALGDAALLGVHQALGGGPGVKAALDGGAGGGDFRFRPRLLGTDDGEAGIAGPQIGSELSLHDDGC